MAALKGFTNPAPGPVHCIWPVTDTPPEPSNVPPLMVAVGTLTPFPPRLTVALEGPIDREWPTLVIVPRKVTETP